MPYREEFQIANPSPYSRSDYVEVDLASLHVPADLRDNNLRLSRLNENGRHLEIPFQIDEIPSLDTSRRLLTFFSHETPPAFHNYTQPSLIYVLEEAIPDQSIKCPYSELLEIDYYYAKRHADDPADGDGGAPWDVERPVYNVKLRNGNLEFAFSLVPHLGTETNVDYAGSVTNVYLRHAAQFGVGEMLSPFEDNPEKRWGQLNRLVFFSLGREVKRFQKVTLLGSQYELVWARSGPARADIMVRTAPFDLEFNGHPDVNGPIVISARLYRLIYVYPLRPFYIEELHVVTQHNEALVFRPYYTSVVKFPEFVPAQLVRFENIPNYFAVRRQFADRYFGYGFAADAHVRGIQTHGNLLQWRIQLSYHKKCVHYFTFIPWQPYVQMEGIYNEIGHFGWYECVYKPIEKIPLFKPYYPSLP